MNLLPLFVMAVQFRSVTPVIHTLKYFQTTSSDIPNFPDYFVVGHVDDVPISRYDSKSRKFEAKHEWMNKMETDFAHFWERLTQYNIDIEQTFKVNFEIAKERFNQTGGVHMLQVMTGCAWDDETDEVVDGWEDLSYDGEDFLSFELQTQRWIAIQQQAFGTKHKWDQWDNLNQYWKHYITEICSHWLKKLMSHGGGFLMRTELPVMSLLQKTPSSPITCHVTGFYPYKSALFWRKDGTELYEDVEMGETLPNHDGTFQMTAHLKAELPADAEDRYECVFQLSGVEGDMVTKLDRKLILSNERDREEEVRKMTLAVAGSVVLLVLLALLLVVLVMIYKRRQAKYMPASGDGDSELTPRPPSEPDSDASLKSVSQPAST
ncbi:major histocompatibility complex class I-related gene protein-like isoform X19 [Hippocampus zosterae]|uniref:major histocompatibility complex class I-related gene protein-like isoform X19 n=1 Tax=Hippocampus zosterae TaxID=109293 RepID=UPI00223D1B43|nr:major histocompatibility complex class I-related gene protein-like isoform X19 [Hippocampus zosterae]